MRGKPKLTERQQEVLMLRLASFHNSQIAEILNITPSTVYDVFSAIRLSFKVPFNISVDSFFMNSYLADLSRDLYRRGWFYRIYKKKICKPIKTPFWKFEDKLKEQNAV